MAHTTPSVACAIRQAAHDNHCGVRPSRARSCNVHFLPSSALEQLSCTLRLESPDNKCVYDASARPCLREFQGSYVAELCRELIHRFPGRFSEVPAGTVADDAILDIASFFGPKVITNDQYRDHTESPGFAGERGRDGRYRPPPAQIRT